ncbi:RNA polymerase-binding protein DksA [Natronospirillum operosum]|uniref:RNA polymerase-binding protein DksA n=1 Tax=Natronospirillum operosum TaxID=2759953 RepID=A0A4Z0W1V2_9GAMM|nr:RNA polymerase-binding protein DksA [Natronospirillum operosum]TGG90216.1 RNA polymerase-binding protein DksA [Natronospirillum operosum]
MLTEEELLAAPEEEYMNEEQVEFFRHLLTEMAEDIRQQIDTSRKELQNMQYEADELDKAALEEERRLQLRFLDRQSKLLPKIGEAIKRLDSGEFGYCAVTGEPIGIRRLLARPTATLCAEEKMRQERKEQNYRDD